MSIPLISIRPERPEDIPHISALLELAFKRGAEARLVEKLRRNCSEHLSLVAVDRKTIVGHLMFTPVLIRNARPIQGMGLAPLAVLPGRQCQGIGAMLVESGLELLAARSCPFIVVLGHPDFYSRFGFRPASRCNVKSQWDNIPDEAFMMLILDPVAMHNAAGVAMFRGEFDDAF